MGTFLGVCVVIAIITALLYHWIKGATGANNRRQAETYARKRGTIKIQEAARVHLEEQGRHSFIDWMWEGKIARERRKARRSITSEGTRGHLRTARHYRRLAKVEHEVENDRAKTHRMNPYTGKIHPGIRRGPGANKNK